MDWDSQREWMVRQQLMARGIRDPRVLAAMRRIPRHLFIPESQREHAYEDRALPIGLEQTISQPYIVALTLQALALAGWETVLEIGTGGGYQAALLGELARDVHTIEIIPELAERARQQLQDPAYSNIHVYAQDGSGGLAAYAPYPAIVVAAFQHSGIRSLEFT